MGYKLSIKRENIAAGRRILVVSDIHGHLDFLKAVLAKANYSPRDLLIIDGDILEKGRRSLDTLRYVMGLREAVVIAGNVDVWRLLMIEGIDADSAGSFYNYLTRMRKWKGSDFFDEMAADAGLTVNSPDDLLSVKDKVVAAHRVELDFIAGLPTVFETQNYIFTHAGLPDRDLDALADRPVFDTLSIDFFGETDAVFDKYVVVGHWPVTLYDSHIAQANPVIDRERRIISIDGGCGLKDDGQLNLLVIPDINCPVDCITHVSHDGFPKFTALDDQPESADPFNLRWGDNEIRVLSTEGDCCFIEHIRTGRRLWASKSLLLDGNRCNDCTDYDLPVKKGDVLSLIRESSRGFTVKKDGVTGWYRGRLEPLSD